MINNSLIPLRLIVTTKCNGHCYFCHKEGACSSQDMSLNIISTCAKIANKLSVPITLTGGEPTLRKDIDKVIYKIYKTAPNVKLGLTTNGANLITYSNIKMSIDTLNVSIISFEDDIAKQYQNVTPKRAFDGLKAFPAINKNINVVILQDNFLQINKFIDFCVKNNYDLDLMFELKTYTQKDFEIQNYIFDTVEKLGDVRLILKPSPVLEISMNNSVKIRIKHPYLSSIPLFGFCRGCIHDNDCYERICSLRVYPNGQIAPCLKRKSNVMSDIDLEHSLIEFYDALGNDTSLLSFITNGYLYR